MGNKTIELEKVMFEYQQIGAVVNTLKYALNAGSIEIKDIEPYSIEGTVCNIADQLAETTNRLQGIIYG